MKFLDESKITLEQLITTAQSEPAIVTQGGDVVIVALPVRDHEHSASEPEQHEEPEGAREHNASVPAQHEQSAGEHESNTTTLVHYEKIIDLIRHWIDGLRREHAPEPDPGMVEVSIALASIAVAIAAFLPGIRDMQPLLRLFVAVSSSLVAFFCAFSALWLTARHCLAGKPLADGRKIWTLLKSYELGPYWFISLGLLALLVLSAILGVLAVVVGVRS